MAASIFWHFPKYTWAFHCFILFANCSAVPTYRHPSAPKGNIYIIHPTKSIDRLSPPPLINLLRVQHLLAYSVHNFPPCVQTIRTLSDILYLATIAPFQLLYSHHLIRKSVASCHSDSCYKRVHISSFATSHTSQLSLLHTDSSWRLDPIFYDSEHTSMLPTPNHRHLYIAFPHPS